MDPFLDHDQTQKSVVNHCSLHFVEFFRHFLYCVVHSCQEEVLRNHVIQYAVAQKLQSLVVFQSHLQLLFNLLINVGFVCQCCYQIRFALEIVTNNFLYF